MLWFAAALILFVTLRQCLAARSSAVFVRLRACSQICTHAEDPELPFFVLVVPVLREQSVIEDTLKHFARLNYPSSRFRVAVVSTEREDLEREVAIATGQASDQQARSTSAIVDAAAVEINNSLGGQVIRRIHYPYAEGTMVHQINWGIRYIFEAVDHGIDPTKVYVGIYNADSRPDLDTLRDAVAAIREREAVAFQQYSRYRLSRNTSGVESWLLASAALWQTRWALAVEHRRARSAGRHMRRAQRYGPVLTGLLLPFNYAIGHGLFVRLRELVEINYLPETTRNEDAPFGYLLLLAGIPLMPLRTMDNAEVPSSVFSLLLQQAAWINGPLDAWRYLKLARSRGMIRTKRLVASLLALRVEWDAVAWVAGPLVFVASLVTAIIRRDAASLAVLASFAVYLVGPTLVSFSVVADVSQTSRIAGVVLMPVFYVLHGVGGAIGMVKTIVDSLLGRRSAKHKTER